MQGKSLILAQKIIGLIREFTIRHRLPAALIAVPCFGVVAAFGVAPETFVEPVVINNVVEEITLPALIPPADGNAPAFTFTHEERIQRGETIASLLDRLQVNDPEALQTLRNNQQLRALRQLVPGKILRAITTADGKLISLRYLNGGTLLALDRNDTGFNVREEPAQLERRTLMKSAEIRNSLFGATDAAGLSDAIATQIADIFSTDIDFHRDLRKGDRFSVVYEVFYHRGEPVKTGRVLAAEFVNQGKSFRAVHYGSSYYTPEGKNMRKAFLRSPLEFSRVTSGFGMRVHPIARTWKAHMGTDYAAAVGTRVRAVGDGVVDFVGVKGGYGNVVILRHHGQYATVYAHLSRFPAGLRRGQRVAQNDTIGFVGRSGWATGPHLHYEFQVAGQPRNPRTLAMPAALPVPEQQLPDFLAHAAPLLTRLDLVANGDVARLE
jgi:murein DD-endopeptidase MepM/ murein hydrolase activator NlpD